MWRFGQVWHAAAFGSSICTPLLLWCTLARFIPFMIKLHWLFKSTCSPSTGVDKISRCCTGSCADRGSKFKKPSAILGGYVKCSSRDMAAVPLTIQTMCRTNTRSIWFKFTTKYALIGASTSRLIRRGPAFVVNPEWRVGRRLSVYWYWQDLFQVYPSLSHWVIMLEPKGDNR